MEMKFDQMKESIEFYIQNGYRVMPLHSVESRCQHRPVKPELDCRGQCWGKVPMIEHWPDHEPFTASDFPQGSNLALIMGRQLDGRWLVGLDIDGQLDLKEWLILPETLECTTNRGMHLVFEVPEDTPLGNWNDVFSTRSETLGYRWGYFGACDVKYCRGAMTSPPSMNKAGGQYTWREWRKPEILPWEEINYLIRKRKFSHPDVKRHRKWSLYPGHTGKNP